jgi:Fe-S-cluster containining protein
MAAQRPVKTAEGFYLSSGDHPYYLVLAKKGPPSRFTRLKHCIFLMELAGGAQKCGIYPQRPAACRVYPMGIMRGEVGVARNAICPPGSWFEEELRQPAWPATIKRSYLETDVYAHVVARWNALVESAGGEVFTANEYFSYLMNVYSALAWLEGEIGAEEMARIEAGWSTPPRAPVSLAEARLSPEDRPRRDFMLRSCAIIDTFYPQVPSQPVLISMSAE